MISIPGHLVPLTCDTRSNDEMLPSASALCVMITITIRHLHSLWASTWWIPTCLIRYQQCIMKVYEVHLSQQLTHPKNQHPNECLTCVNQHRYSIHIMTWEYICLPLNPTCLDPLSMHSCTCRYYHSCISFLTGNYSLLFNFVLY